MSNGERLTTTVTVGRTGSTNEDLRRALTASDACRRWPHLSALRARHQDAGRGRNGHTWVTPPGAALTISFVLRPLVPASRMDWLPLVAGLAARDAVAQVLTDSGIPWRARTKWPNDILLDPDPDRPADPADAPQVPGWGASRKVAGVLAELVAAEQPPPAGPGRTQATSAGPAGPTGAPGAREAACVVVLGVGVNATQGPGELPVEWATSLRAVGVPAHLADADALAPGLCARLAARLGQWEAAGGDPDAGGGGLGADLRHACATLGQRVEAVLPGGEVLRGTAVGLEPGLVLETRDGRRVVRSGEVRRLRRS